MQQKKEGNVDAVNQTFIMSICIDTEAIVFSVFKTARALN